MRELALGSPEDPLKVEQWRPYILVMDRKARWLGALDNGNMSLEQLRYEHIEGLEVASDSDGPVKHWQTVQF